MPISHCFHFNESLVAMKKYLVVSFLCALCLTATSDQLFAQRTSWGIMWNGGTLAMPASYRYSLLPGNVRGQQFVSRVDATAIFFGWGVNTYTRLYEINPEMSIGLMVNPSGTVYLPLNFGRGNDIFDLFKDTDEYGFPLMGQLPVMLHFANGMFSTASSVKGVGFGLSAGVEATYLLDIATFESSNDIQYDLPSVGWVRPAIAAHFRYWNRNDRPRELTFMFSTNRDDYTTPAVARPMFKITYGGYFNY